MIIHRLDARAIRALRPQLATLLLDAVADGFSLGFLAGLDEAQLAAYWEAVADEVTRGSRVLLGAERDGMLVGTVQLALPAEANAGNRAALEKLLVHCPLRRRGVGTALLQAAEIEALGLRRGLLVLDAETGSGAEHLAERAGFIRVGELPDFACTPNGHWRPAAIWYKTLFPRGRRA